MIDTFIAAITLLWGSFSSSNGYSFILGGVGSVLRECARLHGEIHGAEEGQRNRPRWFFIYWILWGVCGGILCVFIGKHVTWDPLLLLIGASWKEFFFNNRLVINIVRSVIKEISRT